MEYYACNIEFGRQKEWVIWINTADAERLWVDNTGRVPIFKSQNQLITAAQMLGIELHTDAGNALDFDTVCGWLNQIKKMPPVRKCLTVWSIFDDLSQSIGQPFLGNVKAPARNRVFDLLYNTGGLWNIQRGMTWKRQDRKVLQRILRQGFRLWEKYTYWPM